MSRQWTREDVERLVRRTLDGDRVDAIAADMHACRKTVLEMQRELGLRGAKRERWADAEKRIVLAKYENTPSADIAGELGRPVGHVHQQAAKLGLKKSKDVIRAMSRAKVETGHHPSVAYRFPKGHAPANKGVRSPGVAPGRMRETQFRKGERSGQAARHYMPLGSTRLIDGYLYRKIDEIPNVPYSRNWRLEHYLIWEKENGSMPAGHALVFKDGNRTHIALDNLELITRADLARRNSIHHLPEDLKEVIRLNASIKRRIRRIHAEEQNDGPAQPPIRNAGSAEGSRQAYGC